MTNNIYQVMAMNNLNDEINKLYLERNQLVIKINSFLSRPTIQELNANYQKLKILNKNILI
ncbi:hypothetical protein M33023_00390 [Candidatus Phytoplasma asteris]|uniref:Uncharacterized protein n=3 Tax=16SrI (Aster yellows group) TaxID=3042590 RepID=Q2NK92_AYWBP|nr:MULTISPECIES: hypothetical protein [16SrI (Aster yellows group)]ABC65151.1 hypothetical protein AYWB_034 [Aster yellows witches'-broom phytoplasma AYWB]